jgi:cell division cycle 20-like protein 1 (cofactor of APC complex)
LQDDFYLNLLDWSSNNIIAAGLESLVVLWSGCSSKITPLYET